MTTPSHENVAALLRKQQSTTARLRAGLPALLEQLESLEEPALDVFTEDPERADTDRRGNEPEA
jgi:hypothetical protein